MKLHEFFSDETKWNRQVTEPFDTVAFAVDKRGRSVNVFSPYACAFCLYGAIDRLELDRLKIAAKLAEAGISTPMYWSDHECPDFATFHATLQALDI